MPEMAFTWFPGHMRKALRRIEADARLVDLVLLLLDARAPAMSRNATLERTLLGRGKRLLFVLSKADMADPAVTQAWVRRLQGDGHEAVAVSGATGAGRAGLLQALQARHKVSLDEARRRGIQHAVLRCMVVGVPNVGKSTLVNRAGRRCPGESRQASRCHARTAVGTPRRRHRASRHAGRDAAGPAGPREPAVPRRDRNDQRGSVASWTTWRPAWRR